MPHSTPLHGDVPEGSPSPEEPGSGGTADGRHSRRLFLAGASAGVAAAAAVGSAALPAAAASAPAAAPVAEVIGPDSPGALVAYLHDAAGGEISLLRGDREVVIHDRALARALAARFDRGLASGRAQTQSTKES